MIYFKYLKFPESLKKSRDQNFVEISTEIVFRLKSDKQIVLLLTQHTAKSS